MLRKLVSHIQKNKADHYLKPYTKFNELKVDYKSEIIKPLRESIGGKLLDIGLADEFWGSTILKKSKSNQMGLTTLD